MDPQWESIDPMTNLKSYGLYEIKSTSRTGQVHNENGDIGKVIPSDTVYVFGFPKNEFFCNQ